jgi:hypothetical protein
VWEESVGRFDDFYAFRGDSFDREQQHSWLVENSTNPINTGLQARFVAKKTSAERWQSG